MAASGKNNSDKKKSAISYWSKDKCICPVCKKDFEREVMLSGNGRMIAGGLTDELHRIFEPSARFGKVYPLIYEIGVCPHCHTALMWNDFKDLKGDALKDAIKNKIAQKDSTVVGQMGTTPRRLTDLIGSLCDLTSGSGDKGTPVVLVQGYFDNYTN